jgi:hypothetical protein
MRRNVMVTDVMGELMGSIVKVVVSSCAVVVVLGGEIISVTFVVNFMLFELATHRIHFRGKSASSG